MARKLDPCSRPPASSVRPDPVAPWLPGKSRSLDRDAEARFSLGLRRGSCVPDPVLPWFPGKSRSPDRDTEAGKPHRRSQPHTRHQDASGSRRGGGRGDTVYCITCLCITITCYAILALFSRLMTCLCLFQTFVCVLYRRGPSPGRQLPPHGTTSIA